MEAEKVVRWTGDHGTELLPRERGLTKADWKAAEIADREGAQDVWWRRDNDFTVPASALDFLSAAEFERFIERDPHFSVEDVAPAEAEAPEDAEAEVPDDIFAAEENQDA